MNRLRAGVIGLGVGQQHAVGLTEHEDCQLVALCDTDPAKRDWARQTYPSAEIFEDAGAMIDGCDLDILCIASYDSDHATQILAALDRDLHIFCEKPVCTTADEARRIHNALVARPDLQFSSNTLLRMSPRFADLKRRISDGELGEVFCIEGDYNYGRLWKLTEGWRGQQPDYSPVLGGGIHLADLMMWLVGTRISRVNAVGNRIASREADISFNGKDMVLCALEFENGIVGKLGVNFGCVQPHFHRLTVYGTKATFDNDYGPARLYRSRDAGSEPEALATGYPNVAKYALIPSFIDSVLDRGPAVITAADSLAAISVCLAIDQSLQDCRPVEVTYLG